MEVFKTIKRYNNYQVSNYGRVKSLPRQRRKSTKILKAQAYKNGYLYVDLGDGKNIKRFLIHRLVAEAFIKNPNNKPQVNHKDGNKLNNNVNNLEWMTRSENQKHAIKTGLRSAKGEKNSQSILTTKKVIEIKKLLKNKEPQKLIANKFKVSIPTISDINRGHTWKHVKQ